MKNKKVKQNPFSKILCALMIEKNIGVRELSRIAGVGPSTIVSWRGGALPEDYIAVKKIADKFGVSLCYLLTGEHEKKNTNHKPLILEVFKDGGVVFDGYAKITIQKLLPTGEK